jgi:hypothetical protein
MRRVLVTGGLVLTLALSGCGGDGNDGKDAGSGKSTSTSRTSSSTSTTTVPCNFAGTVAPKENALAPVDQLMTDVTTSTDGCVDTVTFTFRPSAAPAPSYRVEYAPGPFSNSAGEPMTPEGTVFLKVVFQPAWIADLSTVAATATYTGPRIITPTGMQSVRGLAMFEAIEALVGWVIGLDEERPFTVDATAGKVVIKIGE